ncbi:MAG: hypothetical protein A2V78_14525 [Betaproteobacteria bacterium RBG_16_64_18]|nr:MAG: hypothetical protein A2V78_14525 [Betaproteobacteria bacterium RBG_16_64_18]OGA41422.1 MAG: hypothetical protein A3G26_13080 [Betaproteobacteria bacterium RIFCSPLOWO2_12_FULL_65_110]
MHRRDDAVATQGVAAPIDWTLLDSVTGGDRPAADEMLREFHALMPGYRLAMEEILAEGDLAAVSAAAHRFKGTVSMLGARSRRRIRAAAGRGQGSTRSRDSPSPATKSTAPCAA